MRTASLEKLRGERLAARDGRQVSANSRPCTTAPPARRVAGAARLRYGEAIPRYALTVDGAQREIEADADMPLLYALRGDLEPKGPKFGCGLAQCGYCTNGWIMTAVAGLERSVRIRRLPLTAERVKAALA